MKDYSDKSFWLATYGDYLPNPALQGDLKIDVAIIGAGFTALPQRTICVKTVQD